ncbi:hypothetical protein ABID22_002938 [Pontibacter aydingkolensis]|uniref:YceI-like domain-containing protein n=1 Tax=Pontibacter aydingkolensis TaxID=1911536 RepID=A0ABS7CXE6_9BACT|nr:hypothetical protein [Pontibacter aydingkolensis]MBW7468521.1 hypothetical protein [Pontibacter aydingkolensis]
MSKSLLYNTILVLLFTFVITKGQAQSRSNYTSDNRVTVTLDGLTQAYTFTSNDMLVRYNSTTQKIECILNVATLLPTNDTAPPDMAYDVFFGAKYQDLLFFIDAPVEKVNGSRLFPGNVNKTTTITLQGVTKQTVVPLALTSDRNAIVFNTSFDLRLDNFSASVPVQYFNLLTGRVVITISNAKWVGINIH